MYIMFLCYIKIISYLLIYHFLFCYLKKINNLHIKNIKNILYNNYNYLFFFQTSII